MIHSNASMELVSELTVALVEMCNVPKPAMYLLHLSLAQEFLAQSSVVWAGILGLTI